MIVIAVLLGILNVFLWTWVIILSVRENKEKKQVPENKEQGKKGVRLEHISKIYKDPKTGKEFYAVKDTSLDIEPGTFVTLLGPSGCGKTTTLRMIAGFESPDEGEIYLGNEAINELTPNIDDKASSTTKKKDKKS